MNNEQWQQVKEIFDASLELEEAARLQFIAEQSGSDPAIQQAAEKMLSDFALIGDFMEEPALAEFESLVSEGEWSSEVGRVIGAYRIISEIGRGGMGVVYLAERADSLYQKRVAIKKVWAGGDGSEIERRFELERQILAKLEHPNIAQLFDGGRTESGQSYLVMEYVDGQPLSEYCLEHRLRLIEKLKLFQQVCEAVGFAHRHYVVHRDLKPGNIFVTRDGVVKLLDFGIAKILASEPVNQRSQALSSTIMNFATPEYASPEHLRGERVTTASDVFSLGVVLYELLTGRRPYQFSVRALPEVLRVIEQQTPLRPSQTIDCVKQSRLQSLKKRSNELRGDLDNIILKAIRLEVERRYPSAVELNQDILRFLNNEPVSARPPTLNYLIGKSLKRHKLMIGMAAVFIFLVGLFEMVQIGISNLSRQRAQTGVRITVNSTYDLIADDGVCTLREAIINANTDSQSGSRDCDAGSGRDIIVFDIPGAGPHTISPHSQLPAISAPVVIDGTTQPGASCTSLGGLKIELSGAKAGAADGLVINAGHSTVRGLIINRFLRDGISLPTIGENTISCNYIGTDVSGTLALGNGVQGIVINSPNNLVGGTTPESRNLISGNLECGVLINVLSATGNRIQGNLIGTDVTGTQPLGNRDSGITIGSAKYNLIGGDFPGARNIISANANNGVQIDRDDRASDNRIQGNYIGTDVTGKLGLGNGLNGIAILGGDNNLIGGTTADTRNVISANGANGVGLFPYNSSVASRNLVQGNFIGIGIGGDAGLGNRLDGVRIEGARGNLIGGTETGTRNVISGNKASGIRILDAPQSIAVGNKVQGNYLGLNSDGTAKLPNGADVIVSSKAADNLIDQPTLTNSRKKQQSKAKKTK